MCTTNIPSVFFGSALIFFDSDVKNILFIRVRVEHHNVIIFKQRVCVEIYNNKKDSKTIKHLQTLIESSVDSED